ncbi:hypothetical protein LBMAG34_0190 [Candidatus Saccharibacteria bacterium]|nr:hypothetical protein LBMAG34_0190 [Candidatus Saccharibacteria bacterium]
MCETIKIKIIAIIEAYIPPLERDMNITKLNRNISRLSLISVLTLFLVIKSDTLKHNGNAINEAKYNGSSKKDVILVKPKVFLVYRSASPIRLLLTPR